MAVDANELVAAIEHRMNAMNLWSQGGNQPRAQINEAQMWCAVLTSSSLAVLG